MAGVMQSDHRLHDGLVRERPCIGPEAAHLAQRLKRRAYFAIASYKAAVENTAKAKNGSWPSQDDVIEVRPRPTAMRFSSRRPMRLRLGKKSNG